MPQAATGSLRLLVLVLVLAAAILQPHCQAMPEQAVPYQGTEVPEDPEVRHRASFAGHRESLQNAELREEFSDWFQDSDWYQHYNVDFERIKMWRRITTVEDADAVCNDGSPGVFYVRPGQGQGSKR